MYDLDNCNDDNPTEEDFEGNACVDCERHLSECICDLWECPTCYMDEDGCECPPEPGDFSHATDDPSYNL
jgi:hypothetical protein